MLPSPPQYSGGFPPRDPRMPSLGRYPQIVCGHDISREAMEAFEERQAPLKQVAYARTGRDAATQAAHESRETGSGPDAGEDLEPYETAGAMQGVGEGVASGTRHFYHAGKTMGYGLGALSGAITGMAYGGAKGMMYGLLAPSHESESEEDEPVRPARPLALTNGAHREVQPEEPRPAYLQDRGPTPKKLSMMEKERIRIREKAAMEGAHPFRPFHPYP